MAQKKPKTKDELRAATLGRKPVFKSEIVKVGGAEIEVRQPTVGQRANITKRAERRVGKSIEFDMNDFLVWGVVFGCYVPGTNELVYGVEDYQMIMDAPAGGFFDDLCEAVNRLSNVTVSAEKKP